MGIVAQSVFVKKFVASPAPKMKGSTYDKQYDMPGLRGEIASALGISRAVPPAWLIGADEASAIEGYNKIREYIVANGYIGGKMLRPWNIDSELTSVLDRKQVWWGWEFETGYKGPKERGTVVGHCYDTYDGVVFDSEGEGNAGVEITFTPQERSKFKDGTAQALRFMNWLSENRDLTMKTGGNNVGTHLNISHAGMTTSNISNLARSMNRTVGALEQAIDGIGAVRQAMFGRAHLYGGFYVQNQPSGVWLEGKLFRTTYNAKEFGRYVKSAEALSDALEAIMAVYSDKEWEWQFKMGNYPYVSNLYEVYADDAAPAIRWASGTASGVGSHNGGGWELSATLKNDTTPQTRADAAELIKKQEEEERIRKQKAEEARLAAIKEAKEEKKRREMHAKGQRPKDIPKEAEWCDDCGDWHED